jgi:hypothetical protein
MIILNTRPVDVLKPLIEAAYQQLSQGGGEISTEQQHAIEETVGLIDRGKLRIASPEGDPRLVEAGDPAFFSHPLCGRAQC